MSPSDRERFYDTIAPEFDRLMDRYDLERRLAVVFEDLLGGEDLSGRLVLDAGCGTGHFSLRAHQLGARVVSADIGPRLLMETRRKCPTLAAAADAARLPFADAAFDAVISSEMIEHTADPAATVRELIRVLRPGGRLALTCPNAFWHWSCRAADRLGLRPYRGHENWPGWFELRRWLRRDGLAIERMRGVHLFPFVLRPLRPVLRALDLFGRPLGPLYVNMAVSAVKR